MASNLSDVHGGSGGGGVGGGGYGATQNFWGGHDFHVPSPQRNYGLGVTGVTGVHPATKTSAGNYSISPIFE